MQMAFETTIFRSVQKLIVIGFAKNADGKKTMWSDIYPALTYPGFKGIFFVIDTDGSRRSRVHEARSTEDSLIKP